MVDEDVSHGAAFADASETEHSPLNRTPDCGSSGYSTFSTAQDELLRTSHAGPILTDGERMQSRQDDVSTRPTQLFKQTQIFVEMDELRDNKWKETHRWNFGLEEDFDDDGVPKWNHPVRAM